MSFDNAAQAQQFASNLRAKGHEAYVTMGDIDGRGRFYRVRIGPFKTKALADQLKPGGAAALGAAALLYKQGQGAAAEALLAKTVRGDPAAKDGVESRPEKMENLKKLRETDQLMKKQASLIMLGGALDLVFMILLILAGIGYLKQRRVLGKIVGTVYAVTAILWGAGALFYFQQATGQSAGIGSLIGFIVPGVTLILLHLTFKDDFINP